MTLFKNDINFIHRESGLHTTLLYKDDIVDDDVREVIHCFCVHPNGQDIVFSTQTNLLRHWRRNPENNNEYECQRSIKSHTMPVKAIVYDPTGTLVATASADKTVRVWDIEKGYCTHSFRHHTDIVTGVKFHPDPHVSKLFSYSDDNTIQVYDLIDSECIASFEDHAGAVKDIEFSPDGYMLISVGLDQVGV